MKQSRAITLAIAALEAQIKALAVNANLHDLCHADAPVCVEASRKRTELREAIEALRQPQQARMKL
jgi:hypothetical protein